jgi:hypothetical protein
MPDDIARILHNFDSEMGGVEIPHIFNPEKEMFRDKIHKDVFVCTNFVNALGSTGTQKTELSIMVMAWGGSA